MELRRLHIASVAGGTGLWNSCGALPPYPWSMPGGIIAAHCLTAFGQWAMELLLDTSTLPGDSAYWTSCIALPESLGVVGRGTPTPLSQSSLRSP